MRLSIASTTTLYFGAALVAGSQFRQTMAVVVDDDDVRRRDCNSILTTVTTDDLRLLVDATANALGLSSDESIDLFMENIEYDVLVSKVCGSCKDFFFQENDDNVDVPACSYYGNDAMLSSIALHPLDNNKNSDNTNNNVVVNKQEQHKDIPSTTTSSNLSSLLLSGKLNGFVGYRGFYADAREQAFSDYFPTDFAQAVRDNPWTHHDDSNATITSTTTEKKAGGGDGYKLFNSLLAPLLASSSGAIGILIDDVGTGESIDTVDRSYLAVVPYQQATAVAWRAVQNYTESISGGCTVLDDVATLSGYSAGGYKVMVGADTLHSMLGVEIQQVLVGGGVYDGGNVALVGLVGGFLAQGNPLDAASFMSYSFYLASYSNPNATYLPNIAKGKPMASPLWLQKENPQQNILDWWMGLNEYTFDEQAALQPKEYLEQISMFDPSLFNRTLRAALAGGVATCDPSLDEKNNNNNNETMDDDGDASIFCQSIQQNSVYPYFAIAPYPIEWCHSQEDQTVPYALSAQLIPQNAFGMVQQYEPPTDDLVPRGDHAMGDNLCSGGAAVAYFQRSRGIFNKITPPTTMMPQQCQKRDSSDGGEVSEQLPPTHQGVPSNTKTGGSDGSTTTTLKQQTMMDNPITPYDDEEEDEVALQQERASNSSSGSRRTVSCFGSFVSIILAAAGSILFSTTSA